MTDNNEPYERKDFNDFLIGDMTPDDSPEYRAFMADDVSPWMANFDFSDMMLEPEEEV
ncbi:hypothetical protein LCGC14_0671180 [marine sediment metagenome]|uniref:Uncharacterized protein n=1 Tax=marine sediment metagenome TaxID=412755 RepID=A0A0F9TYX9_9ZZZZ